ncbi:DUF1345 domain-containing protein [Solimicrobium silvestre]|uniref:Putative membrane protein n=1 Tax=Solimicrobium silvestre TaxID=2099400 RepID=A0A2S9H542_9BURK|nr:DUF1345 domain-containing protein [Solimicrobium silvestre]PRC95043.1 putative membrane protein [Solimicrobium silvestre]
MIVQLVKSRPRLVIAFMSGTMLSLLLPMQWNLLSRVLLGWNAAVWAYLFLMLWLMVRATPAKVAQLAEQEDKADLAIVAIMSFAATASLVAIILELGSMKELTPAHKLLHYGVTGATVLGSWCFIATIFTFHYAKLYYRSSPQQRALRFPDANLQPNYWDFLYFSFTIAVAAQTSDVTLTSRAIRKTALAQSVLSFWFNMAILGLSINIAAGLVGS